MRPEIANTKIVYLPGQISYLNFEITWTKGVEKQKMLIPALLNLILRNSTSNSTQLFHNISVEDLVLDRNRYISMCFTQLRFAAFSNHDNQLPTTF